MSEHPLPEYEDDDRTPEERRVDREVKGTFPASDPPSFSAGTATPKGDGVAASRKSASRKEEESRKQEEEDSDSDTPGR